MVACKCQCYLPVAFHGNGIVCPVPADHEVHGLVEDLDMYLDIGYLRGSLVIYEEVDLKTEYEFKSYVSELEAKKKQL